MPYKSDPTSASDLHRISIMKSLALFAVVSSSALGAYGWGASGHQTVGLVASTISFSFPSNTVDFQRYIAMQVRFHPMTPRRGPMLQI